MKKSLAISMVILALNTNFGFAAPGDAFPDVPNNHWAFEAVNQLAKNGIVNGDNGNFSGDRTMIRYEMAQIVADALAKYEKADAQDKVMLDKLKTEFAPELELLDLRIGELEKADSNFKIRADSRIRYQVKRFTNDALNYSRTEKLQQVRTRFWITGNIDDNWKLTTRIDNFQNMENSGGEDSETEPQAYLSGKIGKVDVSLGRFPYFPVDGFIDDVNYDGIKLGFGDKKENVRVTINYGKDTTSYISADGTGRYLEPTSKSTARIKDSTGKYYQSKTRLASIEFEKALSPVTSAQLGFVTFKGVDFGSSLGVPTARLTDILLTTKYGKDVYLKANYIRSNAATENVGYLGKITYKKYDTSKPGSWDVYYSYIHQEKNTQWTTTNFGLFADNTGRYHGYKGPSVGFHIVPFQSAYLDFNYAKYSATDDGKWKAEDAKVTLQINF